MPELCSNVRMVLTGEQAVEVGKSVIQQTRRAVESSYFSKEQQHQKKLEKDMAKLLEQEGRADDLWLLNRPHSNQPK